VVVVQLLSFVVVGGGVLRAGKAETKTSKPEMPSFRATQQKIYIQTMSLSGPEVNVVNPRTTSEKKKAK